jgi:hypothetical protein
MGRRETDHEAEDDNDAQPSYRDPSVAKPLPPAREKEMTPEELAERMRQFFQDMSKRKGWK